MEKTLNYSVVVVRKKSRKSNKKPSTVVKSVGTGKILSTVSK